MITNYPIFPRKKQTRPVHFRAEIRKWYDCKNVIALNLGTTMHPMNSTASADHIGHLARMYNYICAKGWNLQKKNLRTLLLLGSYPSPLLRIWSIYFCKYHCRSPLWNENVSYDLATVISKIWIYSSVCLGQCMSMCPCM